MNVDDGCSDDDEIEVVSQGGVKGGRGGIRGKENEGHLTEQGRWDEASERKA